MGDKVFYVGISRVVNMFSSIGVKCRGQCNAIWGIYTLEIVEQCGEAVGQIRRTEASFSGKSCVLLGRFHTSAYFVHRLDRLYAIPFQFSLLDNNVFQPMRGFEICLLCNQKCWHMHCSLSRIDVGSFEGKLYTYDCSLYTSRNFMPRGIIGTSNLLIF